MAAQKHGSAQPQGVAWGVGVLNGCVGEGAATVCDTGCIGGGGRMATGQGVVRGASLGHGAQLHGG